MKAITLARTILATTAGFARTATLARAATRSGGFEIRRFLGSALALVLVLALAACQADVPDDNVPNGTAGATITLDLGEKPGMNLMTTPADFKSAGTVGTATAGTATAAVGTAGTAPATRAAADQHNAWQVGDVVTITVSFYAKAPTTDEYGVTHYGTPPSP